MAGPRARHPRRPHRPCLGLWRRREGLADPEVHARRQVRAADRTARPEHRQQRHAKNLGAAAHMLVDRGANELFVADGYVNHRIIVFDATTGRYKRHWGAYGKLAGRRLLHAGWREVARTVRWGGPTREQAEPIRARRSTAAAVPHRARRPHLARRARLRLRSHERPHPGVPQGRHVRREVFIAKSTLGSGSVWDIAFSKDPDQTFLMVPDGTNQQVWILRRDTLAVVSVFGRAGHWAGQFYGAHNIAADSRATSTSPRCEETRKKFSTRAWCRNPALLSPIAADAWATETQRQGEETVEGKPRRSRTTRELLGSFFVISCFRGVLLVFSVSQRLRGLSVGPFNFESLPRPVATTEPHSSSRFARDPPPTRQAIDDGDRLADDIGPFRDRTARRTRTRRGPRRRS